MCDIRAVSEYHLYCVWVTALKSVILHLLLKKKSALYEKYYTAHCNRPPYAVYLSVTIIPTLAVKHIYIQRMNEGLGASVVDRCYNYVLLHSSHFYRSYTQIIKLRFDHGKFSDTIYSPLCSFPSLVPL